jgi:hypothetical protein
MLDKDTAATDDDAMVRIPPGRERIWRLTSLVGFCMSSTLSSAAHAGHCPLGPVVFVHGLEQDASIFDHMVVAPTKLGLPRECLHALNYSGGNLPVQQAAEKELAPYVERVIAAERTPTRVNLRWHEQAPGNFVVYMEPSGHDGALRSDALADFVYRAISVVRPEPDIAATPTSDYVH